MTPASSQPQHTSSERQFQKDQPEMFLQQLNFPNPIKKKPQPVYNKELLYWNLPEFVPLPSCLLTPCPLGNGDCTTGSSNKPTKARSSYGTSPVTLCRPGWPQTHRDPPASTSRVLGLKVCATTAWLVLFLIVLGISYFINHS